MTTRGLTWQGASPFRAALLDLRDELAGRAKAGQPLVVTFRPGELPEHGQRLLGSLRVLVRYEPGP